MSRDRMAGWCEPCRDAGFRTHLRCGSHPRCRCYCCTSDPRYIEEDRHGS